MISVTAPFSPAFDYMKSILFRPFNFEKWICLGFCAWLASLGQGGAQFNFNWNNNTFGEDLSFESIKQWLIENMSWLIPLAIGLGIVGIALWVLFTWLSSRGQFMFLHGVATNQGAVKAPWHQYANSAHSLFRFRMVLIIITTVITIPLMVLTGFLVYPMIIAKSIQEGPLIGAILLFMIVMTIGLATWLVQYLTKTFVVPIMYISGKRCLEAWGDLRDLASQEMGAFICYLLFMMVLHIGVGLMVIFLTLITCCIAGCIFGLPFVGTVALLPVAVFFRAYSLFFLGQFGGPYEAFRLQDQPRY